MWAVYEDLLHDKKDESIFTGLVEKFFGTMPPDGIKPEHIRKYMDKRGVKSRWAAARDEAKVRFTEIVFDFTVHDLKAKGIPGLIGSLHDKQTISGHKNASSTAVYERKVKVVPTVGDQ